MSTEDEPVGPTPPIPVFIITFQRLSSLKETVKSIENQSYPTQVIFIDNNSTYKPLLEYLKKRENKGNYVFWNKTNDPFGNTKKCIKKYVKKELLLTSHYFCVTDPDIRLLHSDCLKVYIQILNKEKVFCVGPALRTFDIPDYYPLRDVVQKQRDHMLQNVKIKHDFITEDVTYCFWRIDTTFAVYNINIPYRRACDHVGIRVLDPYEAQHLDWYLNAYNLSDDQRYYIEKSLNHITHWCGNNDQRTRKSILNDIEKNLPGTIHYRSKGISGENGKGLPGSKGPPKNTNK